MKKTKEYKEEELYLVKRGNKYLNKAIRRTIRGKDYTVNGRLGKKLFAKQYTFRGAEIALKYMEEKFPETAGEWTIVPLKPKKK